MKILLTIGVGDVGKYLLTYCLQSTHTTEVICLTRKPSGFKHAKLTEYVLTDFEDYLRHLEIFKSLSAVLHCMGPPEGTIRNLEKVLVHDTVTFAEIVAKYSPGTTFCFLSRARIDRTEKSHHEYLNYLGRAENNLTALPLKFYSIRPEVIFPTMRRDEFTFKRMVFYIFFWIYYLLLRYFMGVTNSVKTTELAYAIFNVGLFGADREILNTDDIIAYSNRPS